MRPNKACLPERPGLPHRHGLFAMSTTCLASHMSFRRFKNLGPVDLKEAASLEGFEAVGAFV